MFLFYIRVIYDCCGYDRIILNFIKKNDGNETASTILYAFGGLIILFLILFLCSPDILTMCLVNNYMS